jgi:CRP-like cAMP-binding protein
MKSRRTTPLTIKNIHPHACTAELRLSMLKKVPFFKSISDSDFERINKLSYHKSYYSDNIIYFSGDKASFLFVVISGNVRLVKHSADGRDVLIDILNPGDFLGSLQIFGEDNYKETAIAHTDACILSISNRDFRSVLNTIPAIAVNLVEILSERLKSSNEMIRQLSVKSVEKRIAFILLKLKSKLGVEFEKGSLIQIPLSRNDLAEMTGSTPETASRVISSYAKAGIIKTGRKWISIIDPQKLSEIAEI